MADLKDRLSLTSPNRVLVQQADVARQLVTGFAERCQTSVDMGYTEWAQRFVPHLFTSPDSMMHAQLDDLWSRMGAERNMRENVLGHRGAAKTTRTRPRVIRSALEGWER